MVYTNVSAAADAPGRQRETRVLIAENDASARARLVETVTSWGYDANGVADGDEALSAIETYEPDIVLVDLVMPKRDGMQVLRALKDRLDELTVIVITGQGSVEDAVDALKEGAFDYLAKPIDPQRLRIALDKTVAHHATRRQVKALKRQLRGQGQFGRTIGNSPAIRDVFRLIERAGPTDVSVLVFGESGTGKELVARTIHDMSPRAARPFVAVNCAAIPEALLESEIFGHERGAYTGAVERRQGCFELAHGGTLFLHELAEMASSTQAKLLRVLQEQSVRRLGGHREQPVDVRLIAATNINPREAVTRGALRQDLFYRINVLTISMPALRDRREDIPLLVQAFVDELAKRDGRPVRHLTREAHHTLERYPWPGNIRELRNVIERAIILATDDIIDVEHLPPDLRHPLPPARSPRPVLVPGMRVDTAERQLIEITLEHTGNNKTRAAEILGISVKTLHNKLHKFRAADAALAQRSTHQ